MYCTSWEFENTHGIHLNNLTITELFHENFEKDGKTEVDRDALVGSRSEESEAGKKEAESDAESGELMTVDTKEEGKIKVSPEITDDALEVDPWYLDCDCELQYFALQIKWK